MEDTIPHEPAKTTSNATAFTIFAFMFLSPCRLVLFGLTDITTGGRSMTCRLSAAAFCKTRTKVLIWTALGSAAESPPCSLAYVFTVSDLVPSLPVVSGGKIWSNFKVA